MNNNKYFVLSLLISLFSFISCNSDSDTNGGGFDYDVTTVLTDWVNEAIVPEITSAKTTTDHLVSAFETFETDQTLENFTALKEAYFNAYLSFQIIEKYNFDTAENISFSGFLNSYPVNSTQIDTYIASGTFSAETLESSVLQKDKQGFPALDYLFNGLGTTETENFEALTTQHIDYISAVINRISSLTTEVSNSWDEEAKAAFISNTSSSLSGSMNIVFDRYVTNFERKIREAKVSIPAGVRSVETQPSKIESLYGSELSKDLLQEAFEGFESFYLGANDSMSFSDLLQGIGRSDIDLKMKEYIATIFEKISAIDPDLKLQVETDALKLVEIHDAMQSLVGVLKTDIKSSLSLSIITQDNDGD